ncbi:hypothetical protein ACF0H5_003014 [Mactra antiquata]
MDSVNSLIISNVSKSIQSNKNTVFQSVQTTGMSVFSFTVNGLAKHIQMLTSKDSVVTQCSAFQQVGACAKRPEVVLGSSTRHRDSGYSSEFSPSTVKSQAKCFNFDNDDDDDDEDEYFPDVFCSNEEISADEDIFINEFKSVMNVIYEDNVHDDNDVDREVEELLHDKPNVHGNIELQQSVHRPSAPLPSLDNSPNIDNDDNELCLISSPFYHTKWTIRDRVIFRNPFRPLVSRSVGTQTPNPHCQLVHEALRSETLVLNRETPSRRLLVHNDQIIPPLPDVVPMSRDRSVSLPDVHSFHSQQQQQVGRELRRISDDFHSDYLKRHNRRSRTRSEDLSLSLRLRVDVPACWNSLRHFVSASRLFHVWSTDKH